MNNDADPPHEQPVTAWVGKGGVETAIDEVKTQLADREYVKVRFHRSGLAGEAVEDVAATLAAETGATLVDVRGRTAVFEA